MLSIGTLSKLTRRPGGGGQLFKRTQGQVNSVGPWHQSPLNWIEIWMWPPPLGRRVSLLKVLNETFCCSGRVTENRDLKHDDAFNTTWPPALSIDKCCQVTSLSIERTDHHVLLKASSCLRCLIFELEHLGSSSLKSVELGEQLPYQIRMYKYKM